MSFYSDIAAVAVSLLSEFGQNIVLTRNTPGGYSPATGTDTITTTSQTVKAAIFPIKESAFQGTLIAKNDFRLLISPSANPAPLGDDTVVIQGATYTIMDVKTLSPAGTVVLYDCQIRGGA